MLYGDGIIYKDECVCVNVGSRVVLCNGVDVLVPSLTLLYMLIVHACIAA